MSRGGEPGFDGPRASQSAQSASERLFRAVVDSAPNGVVMVDAAGTIVLANQETERLFGYTREQLIGQPVDMLVPARLRGNHAGFRHAFCASPQRRLMGAGRDLFGLRQDGTEIPVEIGLNPVQSDGGLFVLASVVDISARVEAEARFRVAVEASPHGMLMIDPNGDIVMVNQEVERLFGYARDELIGQSINLLIPLELRERHPALLAAFVASPQRRAMGAGRDLFGRRKDGTEIPVEIGLNPIETDEGLYVLASIVDIGPRKQAEEELRRSNEELERFAYVASHDLQEPLRAVTSFLQLLARRYHDQLDQNATEYIDYAVGGAARMQRLIEDLLAFSRLGTRGGAFVPVDAGAVLDEALAGLHLAIAESQAEVTRDRLPTVSADPVQLGQLLANLVGNALKFRGAGPPRVHVGAQRGGRFWLFTVRDNGIGIERQYFDRIFVIFQRLHARDEYPGTGIGLALCKKIVERHGGRIWVESLPGRGTTFSFTIPAVPDQ